MYSNFILLPDNYGVAEYTSPFKQMYRHVLAVK